MASEVTITLYHPRDPEDVDVEALSEAVSEATDLEVINVEVEYV